jgi:hypothetical protein
MGVSGRRCPIPEKSRHFTKPLIIKIIHAYLVVKLVDGTTRKFDIYQNIVHK